MSAAAKRITATEEALNRMLDREERRGRDEGRDAERARVIRIRNACFAGLVLDDPKVREAIERFDGMLLRGEDVAS